MWERYTGKVDSFISLIFPPVVLGEDSCLGHRTPVIPNALSRTWPDDVGFRSLFHTGAGAGARQKVGKTPRARG